MLGLYRIRAAVVNTIHVGEVVAIPVLYGCISRISVWSALQ